MNRATIEGVELEYADCGTGEPVVLIHAGLCAAWFEPFMREPALAGHRRIRYHRAGYAGSSHLWGDVSIADHARHCRGLLDHLGIERAHLVGHSSSADMALQVALDAPESVASLTLMEPALMPVPSRAAWGKSVAAAAVERYRAGDRRRRGPPVDARRRRRRLPGVARAHAPQRVRAGGGRRPDVLRAGAAGRPEVVRSAPTTRAPSTTRCSP